MRRASPFYPQPLAPPTPARLSIAGSDPGAAAGGQAEVERLLPRATVITPNLPEARVLAGDDAPDDAEALARALRALGPDVVVVTGGHRDAAIDVLFDGDRIHLLPGERHPDGAAHGSGC